MLGAIEKLYTFVNCNRLITKVMKKLFPLICFLFSFIPFVKGQSVTDSIVVSGKVVLRTPQSPKVITAIECNPWQDSGRKAVWLAEDGSFKTKMYFPYGHSFTILYGSNFINAYAEPGDSIYVEVDAERLSKGEENALFSGDRATVNNEFSAAYASLHSAFDAKLPDDTTALQSYMPVFQSEYEKVRERVAAYAQSHAMGAEARYLIDRMALYSLSNLAFDYKGASPQEQLAFCTHSLFDIYNKENLRVMMFPYHLASCLYAVLNADSLLLQYAKEKDFQKYCRRGFQVLSELPESPSRDVLITAFAERMQENGDLELPDRRLFVNSALYDYLSQSVQKMKVDFPEVEVDADVLFYTPEGVKKVETTNFGHYLKEKYKGKVIYLDIWASWCGPCRAAMKEAETIHRLYEGKEVAFVNVCLSSNQKNWNQFVASLKGHGEHYYVADENASDLFMSVFKVKGFPTYYLLDRNGKIITDKPARPASVAELSKMLDEALDVFE